MLHGKWETPQIRSPLNHIYTDTKPDWTTISPMSMRLRSWLYWDVTQCWLIVTDVSGESISPIFTDQAATSLPLKMGPTGWPETSVTTNQSRPRPPRSKDLIYTAAEAYNHEQAIYFKTALPRVPLENITVGHLIQNSSMFDGIRSFVAMFKRLICWCLSSDKSTPPTFFPTRCNITPPSTPRSAYTKARGVHVQGAKTAYTKLKTFSLNNSA